MNKPYLIGISGGSASGKTTLIKYLSEHFLSEELTLISMDNYYKDIENQVVGPDGKVNFDHPDALQLDLFADHVSRLLKEESVSIREYTFNTVRETKMITYNPAPIIVVEGLFIFYMQSITALFDLKIFVDAEEHLKLGRRIRRDYTERGYELKNVLEQYEQHVMPMYNTFVLPYKSICDIIIPNNHGMDKAIEVIYHHLRAKLS